MLATKLRIPPVSPRLVPRPCALVLDDHHLIAAQPAYEAVSFLLEQWPPQLHLALLTRGDPPLPLSRLRVGIGKGQRLGLL